MDAVLNEAADGAGLQLDRVCDGGAGGVLAGLTQALPPPLPAAGSPRCREPVGRSTLARSSESRDAALGRTVLRGSASQSPAGSPGPASHAQVPPDALDTMTQALPGDLSSGLDGVGGLSGPQPAEVCSVDDAQPGILTQVPPAEEANTSAVVGDVSQVQPPGSPSRVPVGDSLVVGHSPRQVQTKASQDQCADGMSEDSNALAQQTPGQQQPSDIITLSSDAVTGIGGSADDSGAAATNLTRQLHSLCRNRQL